MSKETPEADERATLRISGMVCRSCESRIDKRLAAEPGVGLAKANYRKNTLELSFDPGRVSLDRIGAILDEMGYGLSGPAAGGDAGKFSLNQALDLIIFLLAFYLLASHTGLLDLLNVFPEAEEGMGYGTILIVGLLTSGHCLAMCGGINLSQTALGGSGAKGADYSSTFLYGAGRVVSYTLVGAAAGGLGSAVSFSAGAKGLVQAAAGLFMIILGVNLLGMFPWLRRFMPRLPSLFSRNAGGVSRTPLYVGLLNGFMPCGPLQAMQIYALSTGSPISGGLAMFFFSLGTLPLTMGLGIAGSYLGRRFLGKAIQAGAVLVLAMGFGMLGNGLRLAGFSTPSLASDAEAAVAMVADGRQTVVSELASSYYPAIRVRSGIPLRWNLHVGAGTLNGCNNRIVIPEFGIEKKLVPGDNFIEFTPSRAGVFPYTCWMGMIYSRIIVGDVDDTGDAAKIDPSLLPTPDEDYDSKLPWETEDD